MPRTRRRRRPNSEAKTETPDARLALLPADSVTHHSITVRGTKLAYTATAGTMKMRDEKGEPTASIFYVAYTLDGAPRGQPARSAFSSMAARAPAAPTCNSAPPARKC
ncbi:MAG: hypothetical protein WDN04_20775 [Rhodospirillales bacterium]